MIDLVGEGYEQRGNGEILTSQKTHREHMRERHLSFS